MKRVSRRTHFSSSALPPEGTHTASPKAISRRTSYYRVRLEFLRYPQLIPACCTVRGFGPPLDLSSRFNLVMDCSPGFGSCVSYLKSPVKTRFPYGFRPKAFNLATNSILAGSFFNRNTVTKSRLGRDRLQLIVSIWFQILFHRPLRAAFHLSLTVLVHYRSLLIFSLRP